MTLRKSDALFGHVEDSSTNVLAYSRKANVLQKETVFLSDSRANCCLLTKLPCLLSLSRSLISVGKLKSTLKFTLEKS